MKSKSNRSKGLWNRRVRPMLSALLTLLMLYGSVPAQAGNSSVRGTVLDPEKKAMVGATVTLTSLETNAVRTQVTNESGSFTFDLIPPGTYKVEAEASGFKKAVVASIRAQVDKATNLELQLEIGQITESVSVSAGANEIALNKGDASLGNNFGSKQITQLPLESRNVVGLLSLQPGVTPQGYVAGSRADQANITLDGVDVNEQQTGLDPITDEAFSSVLRSTPDSVQEFRVTTSNANATQGRSSGAQVSLVTKSGTNTFQGSLYEFHRNTATTANDFFNNRVGESRPKLIRNLFGGSIGGPIKKDRLFFFYNYEGRRDDKETPVAPVVVPLASLGRGEVRFPNTQGGITTLTANNLNSLFPAVGVNPVGLAVLATAAAKYPANDTTVGDGFNTGGFRFNANTPVSFNTSIFRIDWNATENGKHILFLRNNYQQDSTTRAPSLPDTPDKQFWSHPWGIAAGYTWTISNTLVNSFRYGLTREAFTSQGDSDQNTIFFRFVFSPVDFTRTLGRITPVHNFTDDVSWSKGQHNFQFGTNIRIIRNDRNSFARAYDSAVANPSFYSGSGSVLSSPISGIAPGFTSTVRNAVSAVIGRFSQYSASYNFDKDGSLLPSGTGIKRNFATEEYDMYVQDSWKLLQSLTLTLGLRYGLSRPIYETNGLQTKPSIGLNDYFERRKAAAANGQSFTDPITVDLAGPANDRPGYYKLDKNNFQPRVAVAWTPNFENKFLAKAIGTGGKAVFRGGFAITNDFIGQQLAVQFDLGADLGFASEETIAANSYNVTTRPAPRFTGFGQDIRALPGLHIPTSLQFPLTQPSDEAQRIEQSFDDSIVSPKHYSWNFSYGRELPGGTFVEASYIGRKARNLLATRDVMHLNNLVDTKSGLSWYQAAGLLADLRDANTAIDRVPKIAYFENLFPGLGDALLGEPGLTATQAAYVLVAREEVGGFNILDWTYVQSDDLLDNLSILGPNAFFHPQYAALSAFSTIAKSDYHAGTLSIRQRFKDSVSLDFNYTLSKSFDNASGLTTSGAYGAAFIVNPLNPEQNRAESDFDARHIINANGLWQLPIGKGRKFLGDMPGFADAVLGGWQLTGIFRWNSGLPAPTPFDAAQWATNWNVQSNGVRLRAIKANPTRGGKLDPNLFGDSEEAKQAAYQSFRNARPGEVGDRSILRLPSYVTLDMGLGKTFTMPYNEKHRLQFRWEVFNVTNTQRLTISTVTRENFGLDIDPQLGTPGTSFGNFDSIQGSPRVMQFGLRYTF
jgi:hypothetical protein